jgi:hypothetical protein
MLQAVPLQPPPVLFCSTHAAVATISNSLEVNLLSVKGSRVRGEGAFVYIGDFASNALNASGMQSSKSARHLILICLSNLLHNGTFAVYRRALYRYVSAAEASLFQEAEDSLLAEVIV